MLTLDDVLDVLEPRRLAAAPDGTRLAVVTAKRRDQVTVLADPADGSGVTPAVHRLLVVDRVSGEHHDVTPPLDNVSDARWSADGQSLLVLGERGGERGLWLRSVDGDACTLLCQGNVSFVRNAGHEEEVLVVTTDDDAPPAPRTELPDGVRVHVYTAGPGEEVVDHSAIAMPTTRLVAVDTRAGTSRVVIAELPGRRPVISPDGKHLALVARQRRVDMSSFATANDIDVLDVTTGERIACLDGLDQVGYAAMPPAWSPDSTTVAVVRNGVVVLLALDGTVRELPIDGEFVACVSDALNDRSWVVTWHPDGRHLVARTATGAMHVIDVTTGDATELRLPPRVGTAELLRDPESGTTWSPLPSTLLVVARELASAKRRLWLAPLDGTEATAGPDAESWLLPNPSNVQKVPPVISGATWVHVGQDAAHPFELVELDTSLVPRSVTRINRGLPVASRTQHVSWTDGAGRSHVGLVYLPADYEPANDGPIPIVVDAYPGGEDWPFYGDDWEGACLVFLKQILPQRRWGVFVPGMGGVRYSRDTADLIDPIVSGVEELARLGITDHRVAIIGQSQGGYLVNATITETDRFAAAVSFSGMCNISSEFGMLWPTAHGPMMHGTANAEGYCGGPPWEVPEAYVARSPLFHLHKVNTPLLLVHGTDDTAAGVGQSSEMYVGLRRLSKPVQVMQYIGEWHGPNSFSEPNRTHMVNSVLDFLARHLT